MDRSVQRDEPGVLDRPQGRQQPVLLKGPMEIIEQLHQVFRRDRVQRLAGVIVHGDALDLEKTAGIVATAGLVQVPLENQERGREPG